jgi:hypothetical protein
MENIYGYLTIHELACRVRAIRKMILKTQKTAAYLDIISEIPSRGEEMQ